MHVLAYHVATPGTWSSDCTRYGISFSTFSVEQPESTAAPALVVPSTERNLRRETDFWSLSDIQLPPSNGTRCNRE